ncbi:MAG TPA: hypothetical protein VF160_18350 [Candidatus Dormibacteraeota bacterium]
MKRLKLLLAAVALVPATALAPAPVTAVAAHSHIDCAESRSLCAEVDDLSAFPYYVGHDEPSALFYSSKAGSGNHMQWTLTLPSDPPAAGGASFNFQLHPAFWFGMAMCDTQSAPRPLGDPANPINPGLTCTPDSDSNIHENTDPSAPDAMATHPGTAFMEMQFYPPGWATWPAAVSCDSTQWCAAFNIDSLERDYFHGTNLNHNCQAAVSIEPVNFAFITRSGVPHAPPSPVNSTLATFTPNRDTDLFMSSGDTVVVSMRDTAHGLQIVLNDLTSGQSGSMTSSAANGFGQVLYDPNGSTCTNLPYDFHPEYSTSSELTRVPWAAHSYNIAFADEIGHFDYCSNVTSSGGCNQNEGAAGDAEASDKDDNVCFPASSSTLVQVSGCIDTNSGFDGVPYLDVWPNGSPGRPSPIVFSSPLIGSGGSNYARMAFEADLPRIEAPDVSPVNGCDRNTGVNCRLIPLTDDAVPVDFYPFFSSTGGYQSTCAWIIGNDVPGHTVSDFGKNNQYGTLLPLNYLIFGGQGTAFHRFNDFRQVLSSNPCPA